MDEEQNLTFTSNEVSYSRWEMDMLVFLSHYVYYMSKLSSSDYGTITWVRSYHILLHYKIDDYEAITCVKL